MTKILRVLVVGVLLAFASSITAAAADAPDPVIGTWTLNLAKSTFAADRAPQSQTRTYTASPDGLNMTITGVGADGTPISVHATFKYDGKDYPYIGAPNYDSLSVKRVNGSTVKSTLKKAGKVVGSSTRTISGHGTVLTLSTNASDAKGAAYREKAVYDKQQ